MSWAQVGPHSITLSGAPRHLPLVIQRRSTTLLSAFHTEGDPKRDWCKRIDNSRQHPSLRTHRGGRRVL